MKKNFIVSTNLEYKQDVLFNLLINAADFLENQDISNNEIQRFLNQTQSIRIVTSEELNPQVSEFTENYLGNYLLTFLEVANSLM